MVPSPIPAAAAAASPFARANAPACPLHALALEAEGMIGRANALDERAGAADTSGERAAANAAMDEVGRGLDRLSERAARLAAGSREGALFALVLAAGEAKTLAVSDDAPGPALDRLVRHLWTIRRALERDAALPERVCEYWMPRRSRPPLDHSPTPVLASFPNDTGGGSHEAL
ncbi:hypothetical protein [Salinarimonas ramus]|uniref:Uncharacterized protein n=1 Tax=Salinarimonas ramus TaxID=690164 RepID=A0A917Q6C4_9HYPH|nr:hypothetical protein [Salinarimonas ramus]GGK31426.1 hypothetical protein GCM10011322_17530 [Salinarimonas ramus]